MLTGDILRRYAQETPQQLVSVFEGRDTTYAQLYEQSQSLAAYLQEKRKRKGLENSVAWRDQVCLEMLI